MLIASTPDKPVDPVEAQVTHAVAGAASCQQQLRHGTLTATCLLGKTAAALLQHYCTGCRAASTTECLAVLEKHMCCFLCRLMMLKGAEVLLI
jgi:hypothetical protein